MRIGTMAAVNPNGTLDDFVADAKQAEADGFAFLSVPNIFGHDAIGAITVAGRETERIELTTGVVPTPPRHPTALAQQALTAQAAADDHIIDHVEPRHEQVLLGHIGDPPGDRAAVAARNGIGRRQAGEQAQQAGLADPGRPQQTGPAPALQGHVETVEQGAPGISQGCFADVHR